jgi:hypothetical protein
MWWSYNEPVIEFHFRINFTTIKITQQERSLLASTIQSEIIDPYRREQDAKAAVRKVERDVETKAISSRYEALGCPPPSSPPS